MQKKNKIYSININESTNMSLWVCQCGHEYCEPSHTYGPAVRDHYLLHFINAGKGVYYRGDKTYKLNAGQAFLIMPGEVTTYAADTLEPWEYFWVGFKGTDVHHLLSLCGLNGTNPVCTFNDKSGKIIKLFSKMLNHYTNPYIREYSLIGNLYLLLSSLMETVKVENSNQHTLTYFNEAIKYIDDNYSYNLTVASLAQHIGIERSYLYKVFMKFSGISPEQYLMKTRMLKATELIKTTDLTVQQIAVSVGFKELSHFSKAFKNNFGISPLAFKKQAY